MNKLKIKFARGTSIIEVMVAILILVIVIVAGSFPFVIGRGQIELQKNRRIAAQLAAQKLEELKAGSYELVVDGEDNVLLDNISYTRQIESEIEGAYKNVRVTIKWNNAGTDREITMATLIGTN